MAANRPPEVAAGAAAKRSAKAARRPLPGGGHTLKLSDLPFSTQRLRIRLFTAGDYPAYNAYHSLPEVYRYLYSDPPGDSQAREQFDRITVPRLCEDGDAIHFAVERREDGALIGETLLKLANRAALQAEVGYIFNPAYAGKGYATEAVRATIDLGFGIFGFHRIFARLDALNSGSIGIVERLGLRREAHLIQNDRFNGVWGDEFIYAVLEHEWQAARQVQTA